MLKCEVEQMPFLTVLSRLMSEKMDLTMQNPSNFKRQTIIQILAAAVLLSGCASAEFSTVGKDEYRLTKMSDACAMGTPDSVLEHLRAESVKFCAGRKEVPMEVKSSTEMGIPAWRCTSAELVFRCEQPKD